jgi:hypothetical protein
LFHHGRDLLAHGRMRYGRAFVMNTALVEGLERLGCWLFRLNGITVFLLLSSAHDFILAAGKSK